MADCRIDEPPLASVQHNLPVAAPPSVKSDAEQALTETLLEKSDVLPRRKAIACAASGADGALPARPKRLDNRAQILAAASGPSADSRPSSGAAADRRTCGARDTPTGAGALHEESARAHPHHQHRVRTHTRVGPEVGGTRMTADQVRRDGSKNPVVSTFSTMLGPKYSSKWLDSFPAGLEYREWPFVAADMWHPAIFFFVNEGKKVHILHLLGRASQRARSAAQAPSRPFRVASKLDG